VAVGEMDKLVELQEEVTTDDDQGGHTTVWTTRTEVWAWIRPVYSYEYGKLSPNAGQTTFRIRIWYRTDVTDAWRVKYGSRIFVIVGPPTSPKEGRKFLDLLCNEVIG
jgi:SPP1 family predicted phage head-tail adaptor